MRILSIFVSILTILSLGAAEVEVGQTYSQKFSGQEFSFIVPAPITSAETDDGNFVINMGDFTDFFQVRAIPNHNGKMPSKEKLNRLFKQTLSAIYDLDYDDLGNSYDLNLKSQSLTYNDNQAVMDFSYSVSTASTERTSRLRHIYTPNARYVLFYMFDATHEAGNPNEESFFDSFKVK